MFRYMCWDFLYDYSVGKIEEFFLQFGRLKNTWTWYVNGYTWSVVSEVYYVWEFKLKTFFIVLFIAQDFNFAYQRKKMGQYFRISKKH